MVPTARRAIFQFDGVVLCHQPELLKKRKIAACEVSKI